MKTTAQWWEEVSKDQVKFIDWLKDQYHGEATAAKRIVDLIGKIPNDSKYQWRRRLLTGIASDEMMHARWVSNLLFTRDITAEVLQKEERYWNATLPATEGKSFEYLCAVGHLAETMRLDRIRLLASDDSFKDVAAVFQRILPDEEFHAGLFGIMSTPEAIEEAREYHNDGMNALGLIP